MTPRSYFLELQQTALAATFVATCDLAYQEINATRCYINDVAAGSIEPSPPMNLPAVLAEIPGLI